MASALPSVLFLCLFVATSLIAEINGQTVFTPPTLYTGNNHVYEYVFACPESNLICSMYYHTEMKPFAASRNFSSTTISTEYDYVNCQGYVVTMNTEDEFNFVVNNIKSSAASETVYIGVDIDQSTWEYKWYAGPEKGTVFTKGLSPGNECFGFCHWNSGEPTGDGAAADVVYMAGEANVWNDNIDEYYYRYVLIEYGDDSCMISKQSSTPSVSGSSSATPSVLASPSLSTSPSSSSSATPSALASPSLSTSPSSSPSSSLSADPTQSERAMDFKSCKQRAKKKCRKFKKNNRRRFKRCLAKKIAKFCF